MEIIKLKENCINVVEIVFYKSILFIINIQIWLIKDVNIEILF